MFRYSGSLLFPSDGHARTQCAMVPIVKLLLISIGRMPWYQDGAPLHFFYTPRLGLPSLAAVTPPEWEIEILDGIQVDDIDYGQEVDLVGFSFLTPFANDSYEAADRFRARGIPVVMGGVHTSLMPDEAGEHSDAVVIGEGEEIWPGLLQDVCSGTLKSAYKQDEPVGFEQVPTPKYSLLKDTGYMVKNGIQLVRGCPYGAECHFCIVPGLFGTSYRATPVDKALDQIRECAADTGASGVNVSACCALNHKTYMEELARAITPLGISWCGGALLHQINDDKYIELLARAGCNCIYTETEVVSPRKDNKKFALYCDVAHKLRENGIGISYNFTVGIDTDTKDVFDEVEHFIDAAELQRELCAVQLYVPWPNTEAYNHLEKEGRIIDRDWSHYDNMHVVFQPKLMTIEELGSRAAKDRE